MSAPVSVIIPVYNGERFLAAAIESALVQTHAPAEVIVVDDGSTDSSATIAESFASVRCIRTPNQGVSRARNRGVEAATGEWVAFLDADDTWRPEKLAVQLARAGEEAGSELVICHCRFAFEGEVPGWFWHESTEVEIPAYEPSSWLVRRETFARVGGFDEGRRLGEDLEWLARARDAGVQALVAPETLLIRRIHDANATGTIPSHRRVLMDILRESVQRKRGPRA